MGNSFHQAICSGKLPEATEVQTEVIPGLISICILDGILLEYTVGTDNVSGVQLPFDLGDGFTAVTSNVGVFVLGGSQGRGAWLWNGKRLNELPDMLEMHQRHCSICVDDHIFAISGA